MRAEAERQAIHIPSNPAHVASIRAFVGAIGRQAGCSEETIDDLRLAASEACAQALEEDAANGGIDLRTSFDEWRLVIEIEPCGRFDRAPEGLDGVSGARTRRALIEVLFSDAAFEPGAGSGLLRLAVVLPDDRTTRR